MNLLSEAIANYKKENYAKALELFEQAGNRYGERIVAANIRLCKNALKALAKPKASDGIVAGATNTANVGLCKNAAFDDRTRPTADEERVAGVLDPATVLMLAHGGQITISEDERQSCLARYQEATRRKSADADVKPVNPIPADWPSDLVLAPLPESTNDFIWHRKRKAASEQHISPAETGLSIVIPTFNRSRILDVTLACLVNQKTRYPFEVIVACDGSKEAIVEVVKRYEPKLDIKYVRQKDYGYQLCAVRNLGLRTAKYEFVAILDCDMAPNPFWVQSFLDLLKEDDDVALIGPRKYVDTSTHSADDFLSDPKLIETLPQVVTNNDTAGKVENTISVDWRLDHFKQTDNLRLCDTPFRYFSGGNVAFAKKWLDRAGWFDEEFTHWGGEDNEFGYRLYRHGCFFRAVDGGMAYHQEPPGKENETDRAEGKKITINIVREKVPYFYRKLSPVTSSHIHRVPLVSIYIPAYNCADSIVRCVDSALNQTVVDLEVCICDDGSTDNTLRVLEKHYGANPRVRIATKRNGGIGSASNTAVKLARGFYIGQLDSDDYLEPDAVELCLKEFFADRKLACVYTTNRNVNPDGSLIANGYNWPVFSREKLTTAMIAHHFRMFTVRAWNLTDGFNEEITNAVDYDMYLQLSEVGPFKHVNKISYNRVLHGENTSIKKLGLQKENHFVSINNSLRRQKIDGCECIPANPYNEECRKYKFQIRVYEKEYGKLLICRPKGGLNDMLVQIEKCWRYALAHERHLFVDTTRSGFLDTLENYFLGTDKVSFGFPDIGLPPFDCYPECLATDIKDYQIAYDKSLRNYTYAPTHELLTFDFGKSYPQRILIHEQSGGGSESIHALERLRFQPKVKLYISEKIFRLGVYDAIHVRNTDYKTDYKAFFASIEDKLDKKIVLCTDDLQCQAYAKSIWGERLNIVTVLPDTRGRPLHMNNELDRYTTNLNALTDLFILAASSNFYYTKLDQGFVSGYTKLAELLHARQDLVNKLLN